MILYGCVEMDKSKKEEAKLEAEETFWEGPPSSTEALKLKRLSSRASSVPDVRTLLVMLRGDRAMSSLEIKTGI